MKDDREELEARIAAFLDGQLPPPEAARLEVFLANTDHELAARVISMIHDKGAVQSLPKPKAPEDLAGRIMESVERASLMHGVENLSHPQRRWWQSRSAIAAGLILVLGGFTYFIVQSFYRPNNPWNDLVAAGGGSGARGGGGGAAVHGLREDAAKAGPVDDTDVADKDKALDGMTMARAGGAGAGGWKAPTKGAASPDAGEPAFDEAVLEKQVVRDQETVNAPLDAALKKGYVGADSPQVALNAVKADEQKYKQGAPVVLMLVARDTADPQRLRSLIQTYMTQDTTLSTQQLALFDRVNGGANFNVNGGSSNSTATINGASGLSATTTVNAAGAAGASLDARRGGGLGTVGGTVQATTSPAQIVAGTAQTYDLKRGDAGSTLDTAQAAQFANATTGNNSGFQYNVYNPRHRSFDQLGNGNMTANVGNTTPNGAPGVTGGNLTAPSPLRGKDTGNNDLTGNQFDPQRRISAASNSLAFAGGQAPFRLMLRPAQLNEIAGRFQVHSVTRGANAYVINNDRYPGNDGRQQEQLASSARLTNEKPSPDEAKYMSSPASSPAAPAAPITAGPAPSIAKGGRTAPEGTAEPQATPSAAAAERIAPEIRPGKRDAMKPAPGEERPAAFQGKLTEAEVAKETLHQQALRSEAGLKGQQSGRNADDQWIECIITMEPAANNASQMQLDSIQRNAK